MCKHKHSEDSEINHPESRGKSQAWYSSLVVGVCIVVKGAGVNETRQIVKTLYKQNKIPG